MVSPHSKDALALEMPPTRDTTSVELILAQQSEALQVAVSEIERASTFLGSRTRLHRQAQSELAELRLENSRLRAQLAGVGLAPEAVASTESENEQVPLQAWSHAPQPPPLNFHADAVHPGIPSHVEGSGKIVTSKRSADDASEAIAPDPSLLAVMPIASEDMQASRVDVPRTSNEIEGNYGGRAKSRSQFGRSFTRSASWKQTISDGNYRRSEIEDSRTNQKKTVFADAAALKEKLRNNVAKPAYNVQDFYYEEGCAQAVARSHIFDTMTLSVITFNAIWIAIDTDYNHKDVLIEADPIYQVMENFFCAYFTAEWTFRFCSFKVKWNCLRDSWFIFDSLLVFAMVGETWFMTGVVLMMGGSNSSFLGNASILKLFRLLRLSRMARMARLLRAVPELMVLIKGMLEAMRSVVFTLALLTGMLYIFGITFVLLMKDTDVGDELFPTVPAAMDTLLLKGVLPDEMEIVQECGKEGWVFKVIILVYILLASLTVMNMLVGVLCEVVSVVSSVEKESMLLNYVKDTLHNMLNNSGIDSNNDKLLSRDEFAKLLELPGAARAIQEVGVDVVGLMDFTDFIFKDEKKVLTFPEFMETILQFRGSNTATVKDVVDLRRYLGEQVENMEETLHHKVTQTINACFREQGHFRDNQALSATPDSFQPPGEGGAATAFGAQTVSRLTAAANQLSAAASELACRQKMARKKIGSEKKASIGLEKNIECLPFDDY
jgi:hypothetical protein